MYMENVIIKLERVIPIGKANAIHQKELAIMLGVESYTAKLMVREARRNGLFICSDTCGYWIAENNAECEEYMERANRNAYSRLKTTRAMKSTFKTLKSQIEPLENSDKHINTSEEDIVNGKKNETTI